MKVGSMVWVSAAIGFISSALAEDHETLDILSSSITPQCIGQTISNDTQYQECYQKFSRSYQTCSDENAICRCNYISQLEKCEIEHCEGNKDQILEQMVKLCEFEIHDADIESFESPETDDSVDGSHEYEKTSDPSTFHAKQSNLSSGRFNDEKNPLHGTEQPYYYNGTLEFVSGCSALFHISSGVIAALIVGLLTI